MSEKSKSRSGIRSISWYERGQLIKTTFIEFFQEQSFFHGAALAYYAIFALVPMIYLSLISFGRFVGQETMLKIIHTILREEVGLDDSSGIIDFLKDINFEKGNIVMNIVGIVALLLSSSAMLASLRTSINEFFDITNTLQGRRERIVHNVSFRLVSILLLPVLGIVVVMTYFGETFILSSGHTLFGTLNPVEGFILGVLQHVLAILTNVLIFTLIFKYLHDGKVEWRLAIAGAIVTAVLLYLGQLLIKYYLKHYFFGSSIGVPGTILVILAWMYYSSQIIFLGAKFTKIYAIKVGKPIVFMPRHLKAGQMIRKRQPRVKN
jgi:membrane protein